MRLENGDAKLGKYKAHVRINPSLHYSPIRPWRRSGGYCPRSHVMLDLIYAPFTSSQVWTWKASKLLQSRGGFTSVTVLGESFLHAHWLVGSQSSLWSNKPSPSPWTLCPGGHALLGSADSPHSEAGPSVSRTTTLSPVNRPPSTLAYSQMSMILNA